VIDPTTPRQPYDPTSFQLLNLEPHPHVTGERLWDLACWHEEQLVRCRQQLDDPSGFNGSKAQSPKLTRLLHDQTLAARDSIMRLIAQRELAGALTPGSAARSADDAPVQIAPAARRRQL
jgi:hypothetical protein